MIPSSPISHIEIHGRLIYNWCCRRLTPSPHYMRRLTYYNITWGGGSHTESILFEFIIVPVLRKWIGKVSSIYSKSKRVYNWGRRRVSMHVRNRPQDYEIYSNFCSSVSACEAIAREFSFRIVDGRLSTDVQDRVMMPKRMRHLRRWEFWKASGIMDAVAAWWVVKISLQQLTRCNTIWWPPC